MEDRTETSMTVTPARSDTCPLTNDGAGLDEAGHAALGGYISRGSRQADGLRGPGGGARTSPPTPSTLQAGDERREHHHSHHRLNSLQVAPRWRHARRATTDTFLSTSRPEVMISKFFSISGPVSYTYK